jgi:hypothetical protein
MVFFQKRNKWSVMTAQQNLTFCQTLGDGTPNGIGMAKIAH